MPHCWHRLSCKTGVVHCTCVYHLPEFKWIVHKKTPQLVIFNRGRYQFCQVGLVYKCKNIVSGLHLDPSLSWRPSRKTQLGSKYKATNKLTLQNRARNFMQAMAWSGAPGLALVSLQHFPIDFFQWKCPFAKWNWPCPFKGEIPGLMYQRHLHNKQITGPSGILENFFHFWFLL